MRARHPLILALLLSLAALTGACTAQKQEPEELGNGETPSVSQAPTWDGKEDQEEAMERATRALNAVEPESASLEDTGTAALAKGLNTTFATKGDRPYTFDIACQAPAPHTLTLTLVRGEVANEWEVECGDREADQFNIPAGTPVTARITPPNRDADGLISWRLNTIATKDVQDCEDDITGCEN
ncbi:hypothetical protein [Streptomyces sp. NPDC050121]|uniref:hypothetical protein n=1 Tax=Streptomyces sp. NPDC050121 TaxID=3365601 RepID=UPI0037895DC5